MQLPVVGLCPISSCLQSEFFGIGEGPEYRPFRDLRSVPETSRLREHVENR
jgi:hypothetical protein